MKGGMISQPVEFYGLVTVLHGGQIDDEVRVGCDRVGLRSVRVRDVQGHPVRELIGAYVHRILYVLNLQREGCNAKSYDKISVLLCAQR